MVSSAASATLTVAIVASRNGAILFPKYFILNPRVVITGWIELQVVKPVARKIDETLEVIFLVSVLSTAKIYM